MNLDQELGVSLGAGDVGDGDSGLRARTVESLEQLGSWECGGQIETASIRSWLARASAMEFPISSNESPSVWDRI